MPLILGAASATTAAGVVSNSCRFNVADGAGLAATLGTPTDLDKWTFSTWLKLCTGTNAGGEEEGLFSCHIDASNYTQMGTGGTGGGSPSRFNLYNHLSGSASASLMANIFYRDPAAWYHVVWIWDSGNATEGDRVILYVNGTRVTDFYAETYPTQDDNSSINSANVHEVAEKDSTASHNFNGYFAETVFIDGQALAASSFGEFDSDSPTIWKPIAVSGLTFGNNGFYLDYEDSADLGADASGNSHDFTATALVPADQSQDTPDNNFCVLNPLAGDTDEITLSNGNLTTVASAATNGLGGTLGMTAGKWYWEMELNGSTSGQQIGIIDASRIGCNQDRTPGETPNNGFVYTTAGYVYNNGVELLSGLVTATTGDIISVALDITNLKIYWYKDDVLINTGGTTITADLTYLPAGGTGGGSERMDEDYNFGNGCFGDTVVTSSNEDENGYGLFEFAPKSGHLALCTKNLGSDGG